MLLINVMDRQKKTNIYAQIDSDPEAKQQILQEYSLSLLPKSVAISTITFTCKIDTKFNCENIAKYIDLDANRILGVTHGEMGNTKTNRSIIPKIKPFGKPKKQKKVFYNQVSMYVKVRAKNKKPVNIKLFLNGSIQMTGCKTVENAIETLIKVLYELTKEKAIIDFKLMKVIDKPFCSNPSILNFKNISCLKIAMINSGFKIPFKMDRTKLYNLLLSEGYECFYDLVRHACVNVKFTHDEKVISIFVFEKGSILITGARSCAQICAAYKFINTYLLKNYGIIKKNDVMSNSNIVKCLGLYKPQETTINVDKFL